MLKGPNAQPTKSKGNESLYRVLLIECWAVSDVPAPLLPVLLEWRLILSLFFSKTKQTNKKMPVITEGHLNSKPTFTLAIYHHSVPEGHHSPFAVHIDIPSNSCRIFYHDYNNNISSTIENIIQCFSLISSFILDSENMCAGLLRHDAEVWGMNDPNTW